MKSFLFWKRVRKSFSRREHTNTHTDVKQMLIFHTRIYLGLDDFFNNFNGTQMGFACEWTRHFFGSRCYFLIEHFFRFTNNNSARTRFNSDTRKQNGLSDTKARSNGNNGREHTETHRIGQKKWKKSGRQKNREQLKWIRINQSVDFFWSKTLLFFAFYLSIFGCLFRRHFEAFEICRGVNSNRKMGGFLPSNWVNYSQFIV